MLLTKFKELLQFFFNTVDIKPAKFCEQFELDNSLHVFSEFDKFLTVFSQAGIFFTAFEPKK